MNGVLLSHLQGPDWANQMTGIGTLALVIFGFLTLVILASTALFAREEIGERSKSRHIQILSEFGRRWDDERMTDARALQSSLGNDEALALVDEWLTKRSDAHSKAIAAVQVLLRVPNYFEELAMMVELGNLELQYVARVLGTRTQREWAYWEPIIQRMREDAPSSYAEFEALVGQIASGKPIPASG